MFCSYCSGRVEWRGPLTNLTHTQCTNCNRTNCQEGGPNARDADNRETSEERFGISPQPAETCPLIDEVITGVQNSLKLMRGYEKIDEPEALHNILDRIGSELSELFGFQGEGKIEDVRQRVIAIRAWGQEWKELAKEHAPEAERA